MSYQVLARKWRPQRFEDLIGQEHVSQTLKNAILADRVHHAFLFTGARGVGKTSVGLELGRRAPALRDGVYLVGPGPAVVAHCFRLSPVTTRLTRSASSSSRPTRCT